MNESLVEGSKNETEYSLKIEEGKMKVLVFFNGKQTDVKLEVSSDLGQFADMLKEAIPGEIDDKIIDMLKLAMGLV